MSEDEAPASEKPKKKIAKLMMPLLVVLLAGAGFAGAYTGLIPGLSAGGEKPANADTVQSTIAFVEVPRIQVPVPGVRDRIVSLSVSIETDTAHQAEIEHLIPRVQDIITSFLSGIDAEAYEKRGVLEIIRAELFNRTRMVLGEEQMKDLLIREFLIK